MTSAKPCPTFAIVGVDGSVGAKRALDWAVAKAELLGPVRPVAAFHVDPMADGIGIPSLYHDLPRLMMDDTAASLLHSLEDTDPALLERSQVVRGYAGPALVRASSQERLLIVGSRGRGALAETLLGSVTSYCVKHAMVPVAVIPEDTPTDEPLDQVVVGIDGSSNSEAALRWAIDHVEPGGRIIALLAWLPAPFGLELIPATPKMAADARRTATHLVDSVLAESTNTTVTVEAEAVMGDARNVLQEAARDADLLVVGARGHEGAAYLLLGSVTTSLIHHPTSATVVVPAPK